MYRILVVEDDMIIANAIKKAITKWGYQVECVTDFQDGWVSLSPLTLSLSCDISLPYYDGFHWCTEIRKVSKVPIIFISSASDNLNIVMAMNMEATIILPSPLT